MRATRPEFQAWLCPNVWRGLEKCLSFSGPRFPQFQKRSGGERTGPRLWLSQCLQAHHSPPLSQLAPPSRGKTPRPAPSSVLSD